MTPSSKQAPAPESGSNEPEETASVPSAGAPRQRTQEPRAAVPFGREELGRAAQVAFRTFKPALERIPAWNAERGGRPAASFFASKLLTPSAVAELLEGLAPLFEARNAPEVPKDDSSSSEEASAA